MLSRELVNSSDVKQAEVGLYFLIHIRVISLTHTMIEYLNNCHLWGGLKDVLGTAPTLPREQSSKATR